jgi:glycosyltransferase involved in cell wall biosynthesis
VSADLVSPPRRILLTLDAVGGVWRYALDLTRSLTARGLEVVLVGLGPRPTRDQHAELELLARKKVFWLDEPLDWMASHEGELRPLRTRLGHIVEDHGIDLLHLNLPSQANGLSVQRPVVAMSHSCVTTWWRTVRRTPLPPELRWHFDCNRGGLTRADLVLAPSRSHAADLLRAYGPIQALRVVHNASELERLPAPKEPFVLAAARWWDEGKNGRVLDRAAARCPWPVRVAGALRGPNGESFSFHDAAPLGQLGAGDVQELMGQAAIFAAPSRFEPFGLSVLEAALREAALVLADIPTFRELWSGVAVFADPEDPAAWSDAFDRLARDSEQRMLLGRLARARAEQFSHARQVDAVLEAYREACLLATRRAA